MRSPSVVPLIVLGAVATAIIALVELPTVPHFEYAPANYAVVIGLALSVPCLTVWLAVTLLVRNDWWRRALCVMTLVASIPLLVIACFASMVVVGVEFKLVSTLQSEHTEYRVYRTDGGAMTSFGIVLRRERALVPGLKLVTVVRNFYPASDATLERLPSGLFRITVAPYGKGENCEVFEFKPES
jgi:hypothetical protein